MKKMIFLMTIIYLVLITSNANAQEVEFYEAEKLDNIYTKSVNQRESHFQKSRFFRRKSDNKAAYCIEPFSSFYEDHKYSNITDIKDISDETLKRISLIAYYGYNYDNHTDNKWYAITQLMIWKETNKNDDFFFTDTLNGNRISRYEEEINEINNLVNKHDVLPSFSNKTIDIKYGEKYIVDDNNIIDGFTSDNNDIKISNNKIDISKLSPGNYKISFKKILVDKGEDILFYYNDSSQNLMTLGNTYIPTFTLSINIYNPKIKIEKLDKENNNDPKFKLCDSKFKLFDKDMNPIRDITLDDNCSSEIDNIDLGTYYIKEIEAGQGYKLNEELYEVILNIEDHNKVIRIYNEAIKGEVKIHKDYNDNNFNYPEEHVKFDIFEDEKYINTVTTDYNGNTSIILPYGNYIFKQITTKDGYDYVEDFNVIVDKNTINELSYNLIDYKIKVPDTHSDKKSNNIIIIFILFILLIGIYVKEKTIN